MMEKDRKLVHPTSFHLGFPGGLAVKNLLVIQETASNAGHTGSILGQEEPLKKEMAEHCNILAWEGQRNLEGYSPWGGKESNTTEQLSTNPRTDCKHVFNFFVSCLSFPYVYNEEGGFYFGLVCCLPKGPYQFSSVQSLSCVQLFATP